MAFNPLAVNLGCGSSYASQINPATNDSPLEFNSNGNALPVVVIDAENENSQEATNKKNDHNERPVNERIHEKNENVRTSTQPDSSSSNVDSMLPWNRVPSASSQFTPGISPFPIMSQMAATSESSMLTMMSMPGLNQFAFVDPTLNGVLPMIPSFPIRDVLHFTNCTLIPPAPNCNATPTRERPLGCRTVFVGGLPESVTEDIIREVFQKCGPITIIRMSKKNFCHIRFENEKFVDNAIYLSGYRMRIGSETENPRTYRLHIDYAQAREDQYEWECYQRSLQREMRHKERLEKEKSRPPSPPMIPYYSEYEALQVIEKLRVARDSNEPFLDALNVLIKWLERGDCSKKSAGMFYSMLQGTNGSLRKLLNEKSESQVNWNKAQENFNRQMQVIAAQFNEIEKVFTAACRQKVWDHFTKAQRKNIETWRKQMQEMKKLHMEQIWNERGEAEMELSDEENEPPSKKEKSDFTDQMILSSQVYALKEENDTLKCQLEAYKNEVDLNKTDYHNEIETKDKQIRLLQQTLQGMQHQLMLKTSEVNNFDKPKKLPEIQESSQDCSINCDSIINIKDGEESRSKGENSTNRAATINAESSPRINSSSSPTFSSVKITEEEACLIGLICTFLNVHPFGASVDYIWSYLQQMNETLLPSDVENLMLKFPKVFVQKFSGVGAKLERKWIFQGFDRAKPD